MIEKSLKRRRWFQFRLRTLLIAILVLSLPLSWFAWKMERARRQRAAVEALQKLGHPYLPTGIATVAYTDLAIIEYDSGRSGLQKPQPSWLRSVLGDDFFDSVVKIALGGYDVTDDGLENLKSLPNLHTLTLIDCRISDDSLAHLSGLQGLESLRINNMLITDAGLEHLKKLVNLRELLG